MGRIGNVIKKLKFAGYCFSHGNDDRFVSNTMEIGNVPEIVLIKKLNKDNQKSGYNPVYHIVMEESKSGFFADHNRLLEYLFFADYFNLQPVIEYSDRYCYAEKKPVNGRTNPFEYYFQQPVMSIDEMMQKGTVIESRKENTLLAKKMYEQREGYTKTEQYLEEMGKISARYIRLQPDIEEKITKDIDKIMSNNDGKMLGVHVRGTDFKRNYNGHPVVVSAEEYLEEVKNILNDNNTYKTVFLASDDIHAIEVFQKELGDQLVYYKDVIRSKDDETVMKSETERENHHFLLGFEVLRDMYTLAECDSLVAGLSQVSYAARIMKYSQKKNYDEIKIVNKGINYHKSKNCT